MVREARHDAAGRAEVWHDSLCIECLAVAGDDEAPLALVIVHARG